MEFFCIFAFDMENKVKSEGGSRYSSIWIQILLWGLLLSIPAIITTTTGKGDLSLILGWAVPITGWIVMFYANYFLFIGRLLFRRKMVWFVLANVGLFVLINSLMVVVSVLTTDTASGLQTFQWPMLLMVGVMQVVTYLFVLLAAVAVRSIQRSQRLERDKANQEKRLAQMELNRLKDQLNPHFLFNSLNNISALTTIDPDASQEAISRLSDMLRYVIYDTAQKSVPLSSEIRFMNDYLSLMGLRYSQNLAVEADFGDCDTTVQVPPMLFISLIENAFKYGASSLEPSRIEIRMSCDDSELCFKVRNSVSHSAQVKDESSRGVGIVNLQQRLEIVYPQRHTFSHGMSEADGMYEACVTIRLSKS